MFAALLMLSRMTSSATPNVTSSQASAAGRLPRALPGGPKTANSGRARAPASRSARRESSKEPGTNGIYGPTFTDSLPHDGPLWSWENRLRQRLASIGSTEYTLTWKEATTKQGASYSRLVPSTHPIVGTVCGSWPTIVASESRQGFQDRSRGKAGVQESLTTVAAKATWATLTACASVSAASPQAQLKEAARLHPQGRWTLATQVVSVPGLMPTGLSDTTAKLGALNPAFGCWLMGFLPEWEDCAPTEMPSSPKKRSR